MAELSCLPSCAEWNLPKVGMAMEGRKQRGGEFSHAHLEVVQAVVENSIRVGDRKAGMRLLLRMSLAGPAGARGMATNVGPCPILVRNLNSGFFWVFGLILQGAKRWVCILTHF